MKSSNGQILESPLLAVGRRYVFYKSLFSEPSSKYQELGEYASTQINNFSTSLGMSGENQGGQQIMQAINFLQNSADFERQKELNFFKHYETAYPEIKKLFDISAKDILKDYPTFIANINRAMKGTETLKKELHSEIKRIRENREASDDYFRKSKEIKKLKDEEEKQQYEIDMQIDKNIQSHNNARFFFTANGDSAFKSTFQNNRGNMSILADLIIKKYGVQLFTWSNSKGLLLNERQRSALIAALVMKANELFVSDFTNIDINVVKAESIVNSQPFEKFVTKLLESPDLVATLDSLISQYHMADGNMEDIKKNAESIKKIEKALYASWNNLSKEEKKKDFDSWRKDIGMTTDDIRKMIASINTIKVQSYYVSEDLSMLDLVSNGISAILGGGRNPTDDIQAGTLITTIDYDQKRLATLDKQLWERQKKHYNKIGATSTYESFMQNTQELLDARREQEALIQKFLKHTEFGSKGLNELFSHITIHSTVKGYESAGSYTFEKEGGFGGAAFGSTLDSELKIIDSMAQAGGLDPLDIDNLFIAMINCGQLMIGEPLKHTIENYFSAFMGMLMFNDAQLFASDVKAWLQDKTELSTVQDLHLYQLNGIIVPSSYILQETYNAMSKLQVMDAQYRGVRATLKTDNAKPITGDWEGTSKRAIEKTKLERMHFLAGFIDLLEDIESRLNNL